MFAKRHSWMSARQRSSIRCWLQRLCVRIGETRQVVRSEITRPLNYWEGQYLLCEKRASCPTAPPDGAVCFSLFFLLRVFFPFKDNCSLPELLAFELFGKTSLCGKSTSCWTCFGPSGSDKEPSKCPFLVALVSFFTRNTGQLFEPR